MKKSLFALLVTIMIITMLPVTASANQNKGAVVIQYSDGSYITVTIIDNGARLTGNRTGSKTYDYYDSNGKIKWSADIFGNFVYTGVTSSCTASNVSVTVYDDQWVVISKQADRNGNTATGEVVMGRTQLGVTIGTVTYSLSLSCDANGNLS